MVVWLGIATTVPNVQGRQQQRDGYGRGLGRAPLHALYVVHNITAAVRTAGTLVGTGCSLCKRGFAND